MTFRGLTLIEVLASLVIMTALAAACIPILQAPRPGPEQQTADSQDLHNLAQLAELVMENPQEFGFDRLGAVESIEVSWPDSIPQDMDRPRAPVTARLMRHDPGEEGDPHGWLVFESGPNAVCAWVSPGVLESLPSTTE